MTRFAAIDVGSNASRLLIAEADGAGNVRVLAEDRRPVRMGHGVFVTGRLDPQSIRECVEAMKDFAQRIAALNVEVTRAVVTASARNAENSADLLAKVHAVGVPLEAIDGTEEARLVKVAVSRKVALQGHRALLVDLGGGSLELSEVHHDEVRYSTSLPIGSVRLLESFLDAGKPVTTVQERLLLEYVARVLQPVAQDFQRRSYDLVAGTGGNFEAIAALCPVVGAPLPTIDLKKARALLIQLGAMSAAQRRKAHGLKPDRADVIVPALYVVSVVGDLARTDRIVAPGVGLKDGLLHSLVERHFEQRDPRADEQASTRAAVHLGRRYHFDETHATQVDRLAVTLFDALAPLHRLPVADRALLRVAAVSHDIGDFIDYADHHKHTQYILEHSDLLGVSPTERRVVGCIARYHRRATPTLKHAAFEALSTAERRKVKLLSALLRIADGLDRGHRSRVQQLEVAITPKEVSLEVYGHEDLSLEVWTAERKAPFFEEVFRRKLRVRSNSTQPSAGWSPPPNPTRTRA